MSHTWKEVSGTLKVIFDNIASLENPSTTVSHSVPKSLHPVTQMLGSGMNCIKLESRLPGELSITSDMQMTPPLWQKVKRN